jgi:NAD(P)H-hydrate epimerase
MHLMPDRDRLPYALYRADQVRRLDRCAIEGHQIPGLTLMTRAGAFAYRVLREHWPGARELAILVGTGNNGGDGYVVARLAHADGLKVRLLQLGDGERLRGDAAQCRDAWRAAGGVIEPYRGLPRRADLIVDAMLGTGLDRPLEGLWVEAIEALNGRSIPALALDIPSGLHADTGRALPVAVRARVTVTFIGLKQGLFIGDGREHAGEIRFSALSVPAVVYSSEVAAARRIDWAQQASRLAPRSRTAHKGDFGHVLVVGGAPGLSGAARLAGEAALRAGAGLVTVATHPSHAAVLNLTRPELMVVPVADGRDIAPLAARATVIAVGPGLGRDAWGRALWASVRSLQHPLVVDADGLNLLAEEPSRGSDWVLTPHLGEAARLLGLSTGAVAADRPAAAHALQSRFGGAIVLKGAGTLIQAGRARPLAICSDGNPGMATAGSGDVLTGVIGALRAQGLDPEEAACAGVCLHGAAGDRAARLGERGLIAGDIISELRALANGALDGGRCG